MKFPTFVYKCPGYHPVPKSDKTYQYMPVQDEAELEQRLAEGWFPTLEDAVEPQPKVEPKKVEEPKKEAPPTRAEVEQKATELKITFTKNTATSTLLKLISEKVQHELD